MRTEKQDTIQNIVRLTSEERQQIVNAIRCLQNQRERLAQAWQKKWEKSYIDREESDHFAPFLPLVDLLVLSLADGDFNGYFSRIEERGATLARDHRKYEDFVLGFRLLEETVQSCLRHQPCGKGSALNEAMSHLFHNNFALLSRSYFRELEQEREKFYHLLTHDLRNSLTGVFGCIEMLQRHICRSGCDPSTSTLLRDLHRSTAKIDNVIGSTLAYGQLKNGITQLKEKSIDLEQLAFETLLESQHQLGPETKVLLFQQTRLDQWVPDETAESLIISGDETLLYRAISNYLSNAFKYAKTTIEVLVERRGENVRFEVCDDGVGLSPELYDRVFEDYFQAPGSQPGTGLGLPSVRRIVKRHGGNVGVRAHKETGTCFYFDLPLLHT